MPWLASAGNSFTVRWQAIDGRVGFVRVCIRRSLDWFLEASSGAGSCSGIMFSIDELFLVL